MKHFLREYAARSILPHLKTAARSMNNQNYKNNIYFNDAINTTIGGNFNEDWEVEGEKETEEDLLFGRIYDKSSKINPTEMANGGMANTNSNLYYIQPQQQLLADILSSSNSENAIFNGQHDVDVVSRFEDYTEYLNLNDSNNTSSPAPALILTSSLSSLPALHLLASLASVTTTTISSITHQIKQQTEETFQDYISIRFLNNHTYNSFSCDGESQTLSALNSSFADGDDVGGGGATEANESALSSVYFKTIVYLLYIPIFVFALLGNGTVCYIVQSTPRMRTVTNYFIANLAVGDILMSLFCVPSSFISIFILGYWPFGIVLCHLVNYSQAVSVLVSAYTLVAISIDRYIAIMWPLRPRITKRYAKFIIAGIWIIALATAFPIPIVSKLVQPGAWHVFCERYVCQEEWLSKEQNYYYTWALLTLQFLVPLSVLIFTYTRIALAVWGKRPPGEAENSRDQRMARSKRKVSHVRSYRHFCWNENALKTMVSKICNKYF